MDAEIRDEERLLRAVWPESEKPSFWMSDGHLAPAALKDSRGLSVHRTGDRTLDAAIRETQAYGFRGALFSIGCSDCRKVGAYVVFTPSERYPFHCELWGSPTCRILDDLQALILGRSAAWEAPASVTVTR